jgi:SAM-dependent methyltransferase
VRPAPASPGGRRAKWEAFWQGPQVAAEATHLRSVELALALLRGEPPGPNRERPLLLDLGCGGGRVLELLEVFGYDLVGVDLAAGALQAARRLLGPRARLVQADAFQLGFASRSFDVVLSLGYASVGSYPGVQAELSRVLRPGGVALVDFRRAGLYHLPLLPWRGRQFLQAWRQGQVSLPLAGLRPAAAWAEAGLQLEQVRLFNTYPPLGARLGAERYLAFERQIGRPLAGLLARTALAKFRRRP